MPKNWCLWTVVLEKTPKSPLDSKEIKPFNLKGDQPWIFTGKMMLTLKIQYFGHLMWTDDSLKNSLGKIEGRRGRGRQRMSWLDGITYAMHMNLGKLQEMVRGWEAWHAVVHGISKSWNTTGWLNSNNVEEIQCASYSGTWGIHGSKLLTCDASHCQFLYRSIGCNF